jgi:hypothetical protein
MSAAPLPRPGFERRGGFSPLPNECLWDWARLVSGDAQVLSILYINAELNPVRERGKAAPLWTRAITEEEFGAFCRCTVRAIQAAFKDLLERKVILRKKTAAGFAYQIPFATWPELKDRPAKVVTLAEAEPAEEESEDEANTPRGKVLAVFSKPQKVKAGGRTKPKDLPAAAGKIRFEAETETEFDAKMCDGILTIRAKGEQPAKGEEKATRSTLRVEGRQVTDSTQFDTLESAWLKHGVNAAPDDWRDARSTWNILPLPERLAAVKGVHDRFEQGEYDDPKFIPLPQNYLRKKLWMRPVRPRKTDGKLQKDMKKVMDWAKTVDSGMGTRRRAR